MAELANLESLLGISRTGAEANELFRAELTAHRQFPGAWPAEAVQIENGILTPRHAFTVVDTEGSAPADDLELVTVANTHDGMELKLMAQDSRAITVRHNPDAVYGITLTGGANITLDTRRFLLLKRYGDRWREIADGSAKPNVLLALPVTGIEEGDTLIFQNGAWAFGKHEKYDIGQYSWFEDEMPRTGMFPLIGGWVENFSRYTKAVEYFETVWGQRRLVTLEEYERRHVAIWANLANGDTVGWNNEGGANCFVWDKVRDRMRVADLSGMSREQASAALGVGDVQHDGIPRITGHSNYWAGAASGERQDFGVFTTNSAGYVKIDPTINTLGSSLAIDTARVMAATNKVQTRSWGSLACVYLGRSAS